LDAIDEQAVLQLKPGQHRPVQQ
jgi:hypothetical protein